CAAPKRLVTRAGISVSAQAGPRPKCTASPNPRTKFPAAIKVMSSKASTAKLSVKVFPGHQENSTSLVGGQAAVRTSGCADCNAHVPFGFRPLAPILLHTTPLTSRDGSETEHG